MYKRKTLLVIRSVFYFSTGGEARTFCLFEQLYIFTHNTFTSCLIKKIISGMSEICPDVTHLSYW